MSQARLGHTRLGKGGYAGGSDHGVGAPGRFRWYLPSMSSKSEPTRLDGPRPCKVADALGVVGDRWSLLVVRELAFGVGRFSDIQNNTGAPRQILTARLRKLETRGVVARRRYQEHPPRDEYVLTEAGRELSPVLRSLRSWGERYA